MFSTVIGVPSCPGALPFLGASASACRVRAPVPLPELTLAYLSRSINRANHATLMHVLVSVKGVRRGRRTVADGAADRRATPDARADDPEMVADRRTQRRAPRRQGRVAGPPARPGGLPAGQGMGAAGRAQKSRALR